MTKTPLNHKSFIRQHFKHFPQSTIKRIEELTVEELRQFSRKYTQAKYRAKTARVSINTETTALVLLNKIQYSKALNN